MGQLTRDQDRILIGNWALSASPGKLYPLDAEVLREAEDRLKRLHDSWNGDRADFYTLLSESWPLPEEAVELLAEVVSDPSEPGHAWNAAVQLGFGGLPGSREALFKGLELGSLHSRKSVVAALAWCGRPGDAKRILSAEIPSRLARHLPSTLMILGDPEGLAWLERRPDLLPQACPLWGDCKPIPETLSLVLLRERPEFNAAWESLWR